MTATNSKPAGTQPRLFRTADIGPPTPTGSLQGRKDPGSLRIDRSHSPDAAEPIWAQMIKLYTIDYNRLQRHGFNMSEPRYFRSATRAITG
jgi:hypothetical protein